MKAFSRRGSYGLPNAQCSSCHRLLIEVPHVGWVDPALGHPYDMCVGDPYGNHSPVH
ncbi:hypothetical protein [Nocardioides pacificus]